MVRNEVMVLSLSVFEITVDDVHVEFRSLKLTQLI